MKTKIEDLREHLFATLEDLRDKDKPMELDRAKAISEVAQTIINSAKVENEFLKITGTSDGSGFIPKAPRGPAPLGIADQQPGESKPRLVGPRA
jgi:hypothetical protein